MVKKKKRAPARRRPAEPTRRALHYKVVELSNVDEGALERTVNEWVSSGWTFDGVQFAMRESSKRPSMAFVFFTREGPALERAEEHRYRSEAEADRHLRRLVVGPDAPEHEAVAQVDPWTRLSQLAGDDEA